MKSNETSNVSKQKLTKEQIEVLQKERKNFIVNKFLKKVVKPEAITFWEELTCVGFQPDLAQLEAVVSVKQSTGYMGGLCANGSTEYVRFFVDWSDGAGFQNLGLSSFKVHDISNAPPGPQHPLQYMVYLTLDDRNHRKCCNAPVTPKVRAILSWNHIPSLDPNDKPHFGNSLDATIQLLPKPRSLFCILKPPLLEEVSPFLDNIDINAPLPNLKPSPTPLSKLIEDYKIAEVPDHRILYPLIYPMVTENKTEFMPTEQLDEAALNKFKIDISKVIATLSKPQTIDSANADIAFEQVICAGLNTANDVLSAVIHIKKPSGYSGNLCQTGSLEYVAFWADYNNDGAYDEYLGTAMVRTHDIGAGKFPTGGLYYAVMLSCNFTSHLKDCKNPNIIRIRAVLSWNTPPSAIDPNLLNFWGNRIDVVVQIRPGVPAPSDDALVSLIYTVGGVALADIDPVYALAYHSIGPFDPNNCSQPVTDRPFGGNVKVTGRIYNTGSPSSVHFQVQYTEHNTSNWRPVTISQTFALMYPTDLIQPEHDVTLSKLDGWFPYLEDPTATPPIFERDNLLADWHTGNLEGQYDIRLKYTRDYPLTPASIFGYSKVVTIWVHNKGFTVSPTPNAAVDMGYDVDLVIDGGDCHAYFQGDIISGHLRAKNDYFWICSLDLQPSTHTHTIKTKPPCKTYGALPFNGYDNELWGLNTVLTDSSNNPIIDPNTSKPIMLDPCGYTLTLWAYDRTIVDSNGAIVHWERKAVGFSIKEKPSP